jgi:hypothetical protein
MEHKNNKEINKEIKMMLENKLKKVFVVNETLMNFIEENGLKELFFHYAQEKGIIKGERSREKRIKQHKEEVRHSCYG